MEKMFKIEANLLIFPAPQQSYTADTLNSIIYVPSKNSQIPCLYWQHMTRKQKFTNMILVYFHGNAEDIGSSQAFLEPMKEYFQANSQIYQFNFTRQFNILAMEYKGYGIYEGKPSPEQLIEDAETVYRFLQNVLEYKEEEIIIFGRSIGTGIATALAAYKKCASLILMSPFTSIRNTAKDLVGGVLGGVLMERFENIVEIQKVNCSIFLIHGKLDKLVPYQHSKELYIACLEKKNCEFHFPITMSHNSYNQLTDIIQPMHKFLKSKGIQCKTMIKPKYIPPECLMYQLKGEKPKQGLGYKIYSSYL